jgi:Flp pilus assembly protein TadB
MILLADLAAILIPGAFFATGLKFIRSKSSRQAVDVLSDLRNIGNSEDFKGLQVRFRKSGKEKKALQLHKEVMICMLIAAISNLFISNVTSSRLIVSLIIGAAVGIIIQGARSRAKIERDKRALDYYLPIVMERIVMAVESGLDIIPALDAVVDLQKQELGECDPVTKILISIKRYTDSGLGFLEALEIATSQVQAPSVKHALVHLGIAYREGGEIIHPLRELGDATQLYYQEAIEEDIAKMPVKATVPLLCTFAGLIISFLTSPIIQVMSITSKAMPK